MTGVHIETKRSITLSLTAGDWELYESVHGANDVATSINRRLEAIFNTCSTEKEFWKMEGESRVLSDYAEWGARDSEPLHRLESIVRVFYSGRSE